MPRRRRKPYSGYRLRWDYHADAELDYLFLAEARELFYALCAAEIYRKVELFGVVSEERVGAGDLLEPLDRWERPAEPQ